jgi:NAD(P)-dependent dehydrogenase (short-subunit alcohol dehydrogenase family)
VLIHCAGGFRFAKSEDILDEDIEFLINTNLKSAMYLIRELIPSMKKRNFGRIILIGSKSTSQPGAGEHMGWFSNDVIPLE